MKIDGLIWFNPAKKEMTGYIYLSGNPDEPLEQVAKQMKLNYEIRVNNKEMKILKGIYRENQKTLLSRNI